MHVTDQPAIQAFLHYLKFEKRYSEHTISSYQVDLLQFFTYLSNEFDIRELDHISASFVRSWMASLKDTGISARSINRKLSSLKSFFKYQMREGAVASTPVNNITAPKTGRKLPVYVEKGDMEILLKDIAFPEGWKGDTDKLIIQILYNTGMRVSELVHLKESQVDISNKTLKVLGKGNKERILPLSAGMVMALSAYMARKRAQMEEYDKVYLLVNKKGKKLDRIYAYAVVKAYLRQVTTIEKKSPHVLRHSFATHLANNGADLNSIKELLGHASLAATQIYTHNTIEKLKDIHKKAHPKA